MSSTTTASAAGVAAVERQMYWCHECDMSVSLLSSSAATSSLLCPHCRSDFLEQLDSPLIPTNPDPNPNPNLSPFSFLDAAFPVLSPTTATTSPDPGDFRFPPAPAADDNYLLDSPYLHRLIQHLANSEPDNSFPTAIAAPRCHSPASKAAVEAIPTVKISVSSLELDPVILCAVCKDQFAIDDEAKQLPCKHMYHSDCILPWLSQHNSCPVCRYELPTESDEVKERRSRLEDLMMEEESWLGFESTLRHIARRHRVVLPDLRQGSLEQSLLSPTQVGEAEAGTVERANSVETVSSWPIWPVEGGANEGVGGDGEIATSAMVVNDDGDNLMA